MPNRSTTSSTTAEPSEKGKKAVKKKGVAKKQRADAPPPIEPPPVDPRTIPIDDLTREAIVGLMTQGLSPLIACNQTGVLVGRFFHAYDTDDTFRERVEEARDALGWNVASKLYATAIGGNVTAMTTWLKLRPPRDWNPHDDPFDSTDIIEELEGFEIVDSSTSSRTSLPPRAATLFPPPGE